MPKTCLDQTGLKIVSEIYASAESRGAKSDLLALIGSWGDTLDDEDILQFLRELNQKS